jgi:hypothetical protein
MIIHLKKSLIAATVVFPLVVPLSTQASEAVETLLNEYRSQGATVFSAEDGKTFFNQAFTHQKTGDIRQCTACHTEDLRNHGEHVRTGKDIKPLAPSANPESLTNIKHIRKWLKRNCKWTLGRECDAQEKANLLTFIQSQ